MKINNFIINKKKTKLIPTNNGRRGGSINAKLVAEDVKKKVASGSKVLLAPIIRKRGYSEAIARQPHKVTQKVSMR